MIRKISNFLYNQPTYLIQQSTCLSPIPYPLSHGSNFWKVIGGAWWGKDDEVIINIVVNADLSSDLIHFLANNWGAEAPQKKYKTTPVPCPLSPVPCPLSPVPCPLSPVPCLLSPVLMLTWQPLCERPWMKTLREPKSTPSETPSWPRELRQLMICWRHQWGSPGCPSPAHRPALSAAGRRKWRHQGRISTLVSIKLKQVNSKLK